MLLAGLLTGCSALARSSTPGATETAMPDPRTVTSPDHFAAMQGRLEQMVPSLQETSAEAGVGLEVLRVRDSSCLRPENKEQQEETRWEGWLQGDAANKQSANAALDQMSVLLKGDGWALLDETNHPKETVGVVRVLYFVKDGLSVTAKHDLSTGTGPGMLDILAATRCVEHSNDHQMLRSTLDPQYGGSSEYYSDGK